MRSSRAPTSRPEPRARLRARLRGPTGILLAFAVLAAAGCSGRARNAVLITIDTLRADHASSYGYARETTPELDRFFASGSVFETAISSAPCTVPSLKQLLRGSFETGPEVPTLAERLRGRGYATAAFVSQHQFHRELDAYRRGFEVFDLQAEHEVDRHGLSARGARQVADRALAWLDSFAGERPFLLWLHFFDPHDPYEPPAAHRGFDAGNRSRRSGDRRSDLLREKRSQSELARDAGYIFSAEDVQHLINLYDGEIQYADREIGRVLAALEARGLLARSAVVATSDHGERLGRANHWDHCATLHDDELRVPLWIRVDGAPLAGRARVRAPASTLDIVPTLLALLGDAPQAERSFARDLRGIGDERAALAYWRGSFAVRARDWKLVSSSEQQPPLLHHLPSDPLEQQNLVGRGEAAETHLARELEPLRGLGPRLELENARQHEALRVLGYLE